MNWSFIFWCWQQVLNWAVLIGGALVIIMLVLIIATAFIKVLGMLSNWINK